MSFFEKFIGRHRAVALRLWLYEFGALGIVGILFLAAAVSMVIFFELEPHRHDSFRSGKVQGIVPMGGKSGGYLVDLELEDGTHLRLMTARGAIMGGIIETACVERREYSISGGYRYKLVLSHNCQNVRLE